MSAWKKEFLSMARDILDKSSDRHDESSIDEDKL
jgi:hypothetical protein